MKTPRPEITVTSPEDNHETTRPNIWDRMAKAMMDEDTKDYIARRAFAVLAAVCVGLTVYAIGYRLPWWPLALAVAAVSIVCTLSPDSQE